MLAAWAQSALAVMATGAIAYGTQIYNSTLAENSSGKAVSGCTLINSIVWNNPSAGPQDNISTNCCIAASAVASGTDNIDADPLFVASGDWPYRLAGG